MYVPSILTFFKTQLFWNKLFEMLGMMVFSLNSALHYWTSFVSHRTGTNQYFIVQDLFPKYLSLIQKSLGAYTTLNVCKSLHPLAVSLATMIHVNFSILSGKSQSWTAKHEDFRCIPTSSFQNEPEDEIHLYLEQKGVVTMFCQCNIVTGGDRISPDIGLLNSDAHWQSTRVLIQC